MPKRELSSPSQIIDWLEDWGSKISEPAEMILIGSGALLWHVHQSGRSDQLPENSMDVDPITSSEEVAILAYDSIIGSKFEQDHGWHVNLMPDMVLKTFPSDWMERASKSFHGNLTVIVPCIADLLAPKLMRNEPRDVAHAEFMSNLGLYEHDDGDSTEP
ncbi:MAG: DUF6036 family nucleotidyltransferase [Verrucomicrobiota bacterium]